MVIQVFSSTIVCLFLILIGELCAQEKYPMVVDEYRNFVERPIHNVQNLSSLLPKSVAEIELHVDLGMKIVQQDLDKILTINAAQRTFDNTARAFDQSKSAFFHMLSARIYLLSMVSSDQEIRDVSHKATIALNQFAVDAYDDPALYQAFQEYLDHQGKTESLNDEQRYFLQETMLNFKREGLHLPEQQLSKVKKLKKEIAELGIEFAKNIAVDKSKIHVDLQGLQGVSEQMIKNLARDGDLYILGCDYPTYGEVMNNCSVGKTRKSLYLAFNNRAYPENVKLLELILAKRDVLAKKLGFESFAALNIASEMAQTPAHVETFLQDLMQKAQKKASEEFALLRNNLPDGVTLDEQGKMYPWDYAYVKSFYKKKFFDIDERVIAEYFPVDKALEGMLSLYQDFLGLEFKEIEPVWKWHEDVKLIQIFDRKTDKIRGYLFLDLYPRPDKYTHACYQWLVVPQMRKNSANDICENIPSVGVMIANFPRASDGHPALFKHSDVKTFFHEFGHAMHDCLSRTELATFAGCRVKCDFVEMPSKMFEEWMFDKEALKKVSGHYQTGQPLSDDLIDKKIALKCFDSGYFVQVQALLSYISLYFHASGVDKNTNEIASDLYKQYVMGMCYESDSHHHAAFGHLMEYAARYYTYLWSHVLAIDIFEQIKEAGFDSSVGKKFVQTILGRGGSADPNILLKDFLGREPQADAFMKDMGLI